MAEDFEMIGVRMNALLGPLCECIQNLCECIKDHSQQPGVMPCNAYPLYYRGSIPQTVVCHTAVSVFQVPKGQTATITRISFAERYPGTLYGATFILMVNDNFDPAFPRVDHPTGTGLETGRGTRICLEEQDIISVMLQCSWFPADTSGQAATYIQTIYPFEIEGYFEYKVVA